MVVAALAIFQRASGATRYLALLPFAVGMLTKPTALALVPILGLHVLFYETRPGGWGSLSAGTVRTNLRPFVPVGVFALVGAALFLLIERMTPDTWVPGGASRTRYLLTQPFVIASYAWTWLLPFDLSADTDWGTVGSWADWRVGAGALFLSGVGYVFCRAATVRRTFPIAFGIGWYLVALAPTSSIFALAEVKNDHRVFFPNIGLTLAVGWGIVLLVIANEARILRSRSWRLALPLILLAFLGAHTLGVRERSRVWATEESLWHDVVQKSPGNGRGLMNYGLTQMRQGRYDAAREYFEKALVLLPGYSVLQVNLAIVKNAMGETAGVESHFRRALDLDPGSPGSYYFYASWLRERERYGEAAALLRRALDLAPADTASRRLLMDVLADTGEVESLERLARETLETSRHDTKATRYLELLAESFERYRAGDHAGCIEASEMALALRADYAPAYNNICAAYNALGQWDAGAASCSRALEIDPGFTLARNNLAWAMAEQGRAAEKSTPEPPATLARY
jgi:tetratricopeptide (TPR) repeat protein